MLLYIAAEILNSITQYLRLSGIQPTCLPNDLSLFPFVFRYHRESKAEHLRFSEWCQMERNVRCFPFSREIYLKFAVLPMGIFDTRGIFFKGKIEPLWMAHSIQIQEREKIRSIFPLCRDYLPNHNFPPTNCPSSYSPMYHIIAIMFKTREIIWKWVEKGRQKKFCNFAKKMYKFYHTHKKGKIKKRKKS